MLGAPRVKAVRGVSDFGYSYVYVIFEDGTDIYWARTRTLEYLASVLPTPSRRRDAELGPDATGLGWVSSTSSWTRSGTHSLAELRSVQDWYLRYSPADRFPASPRSRRSAASAASTRSTSIRTGCGSTASRSIGWWMPSAAATAKSAAV